MKEYRGKIPFLLKEIGGKILYLCSSNRNIEDYYNVLSDIYSGNILKLENTQSKDELEKDNYDLLEILKSEEDFIFDEDLIETQEDMYYYAVMALYSTYIAKKEEGADE